MCTRPGMAWRQLVDESTPATPSSGESYRQAACWKESLKTRRAEPERGWQAHTQRSCVYLSHCVYMYVIVCACTHTHTHVCTHDIFTRKRAMNAKFQEPTASRRKATGNSFWEEHVDERSWKWSQSGMLVRYRGGGRARCFITYMHFTHRPLLNQGT